MKKIFLTGILILLLFMSLSADIYIKTRVNVDPINAYGQVIPARETYAEQWVSDDFYLVSDGVLSYLFDLKKNLLYLILHRTKSYIEVAPPVDYASLLPEELSQMAQSLQQMTLTVTPTGETKIINNIKCQGYRLEMTMMMYPIEMKIWASEELPVNLKKFLEKVQPEIIKMQLRATGPAVAEIQKIKGLWIAYDTKAQMMGMEVTSRAEVVELSQKPASKGIYSVPAGYVKKDKLEMADIQGF
ncbi:MAG: hypothetical protein H5U06_08765 [Candidatus Aminicenantes bacterium]|nr:hypothetical protein [Candidatus Aminicenantes bacterium]